MRLDYHATTGAFSIRVPRAESILIQDLMESHGLDFSTRASTPSEAVLLTHDPYAAVAFWQHATPEAQAQLIGLNREIDLSWATESQGHIKCPANQELSPFQIAGVEYALRRKNTLVGDVPGLGKTMQAICFCNEVDARRILVVCPANIRLQWCRKIREWSTMVWPYHVYPVLAGRHGVHPTAAWTVVSYDLARTPAIHAALARGSYDVLILDEGHYLKTVDARRTRAIFGGGRRDGPPSLASRSGAILALTGTPLPNRPREAFTLARGLCPDAIDFMGEDAFRQRFNPAIAREDENTGKVWVDERTGRHGELQARLRVNFMVRREKHGPHGVMNQLKLPLFDIVHVEEDGPVKQALNAERMLDIDPEFLPGPSEPDFGAIATVRRMMGVAIAPHAADYVEMCLLGGEDKVVVFGHHIEVLNIIQARLQEYGVVRIDGSTSPARRQAIIDQFCNDPSKRVCLGNLISMGTGTDGLQHVASHAIFAEPDWTPGVNIQGVDRLDRHGQTEAVQADFLVAPGSFSEKILRRSLEKAATIEKALDKRF